MEINRRQFLRVGTLGFVASTLTSSLAPTSTPLLRIALLHLAPIPGDLAHNRQLVETAITTAAGLGAAWIITPELCICGYSFADQIGTEWILPQPDPWMRGLCQQIARRHVTVFMSHPERDAETGTHVVLGTGPPGFHGPDGEWERCTRDTGLALLVCNRTGPDRTLNFTAAESVIVKDGQRLLSFQAEGSTVFTIDWDLETQSLASQQYQSIDL